MPIYVNMDEGSDVKDLSNFEPSPSMAFDAAVSSTFAENPLLGLGVDFAKLQTLNMSGGGQRNASMYRKRLSRDEAMAQVKASGQAIDIPESGYTQQALDYLIERKRLQQERASITDRTSWGLGSIPRGIGMLAAGMADPTSWIPGVRPAVALPTTAARSFMTRAGERAFVGAIEGATAAAAVEPFSVAMKYGMGDDYNFTDSLINIGFGAAMGSVLAPTVGVVADRMRPASAMPDVAPAVRDTGNAPSARAEPTNTQPMRAIDLPEFKAWFGGSKVVDDAGQPLVVYHGTGADFEQFSREAIGSNNTQTPMSSGFFFAKDSTVAGRYAPKEGGAILPTFVKIENPAPTIEAFTATGSPHDGFVNSKIAVVRRPEQIKSAIGNSGKFDPNSTSLTDPLQPGEVSPFNRQRELKTAAMYSAINDFNNGTIPNVEHVLKGEQPTPQAEAEPVAMGESSTVTETIESEADDLLSNAMADVQAIQTSLENEGMKVRPIADAFKVEDAAIAREQKIGEGFMQAVLCRARR